jgi:RHS repeat-associated protein
VARLDLRLGFRALVLLLAFSTYGFAGVITFEDLPDAYFFNGGDQNVGDFYSGAVFGPNVTALSVSRFGGYDDAAFPPHSGDVVVWDPVDSAIMISFDSPIQSFGVWYTSFDPLSLQAFGPGGVLLGTLVGGPNTDGSTGSTSYLELSASSILSVQLTGSPGLYTLDDVTTTVPTAAPEPGTIGLVAFALFGLLGLRALGPCGRLRGGVGVVVPGAPSVGDAAGSPAFRRVLPAVFLFAVVFLLPGRAWAQGFASFADSFEGATLSTWWTVTNANGIAQPYNPAPNGIPAHSGAQVLALGFGSGAGKATKISLSHTFPAGVKGSASIFVFDVSPPQALVYDIFELSSSSNPSVYAEGGIVDYDPGFYHWSINGATATTPRPSPYGRWVKWTITFDNNSITIAVDGNPILVQSGNFTFDTIQIYNSRAVAELFNSYPLTFFDDFSLTPICTTEPTITAQPSSQSVSPGGTATLSVEATGAPLQYQWYANSQPISAATSSSLNTGPLTSSTDYFVIVSGACQSVTSETATVTVQQCTGPAINTQPADQTATEGNPVTLSVSATGTGLSYQWYQNGSPIVGATAGTYTTGALSRANDGTTFYVVVTGQCGTPVTSRIASVTVVPVCTPPTIVTGPASQSVAIGTSASLSTVANGSALTYQWRQNGTSIANATSSSYTTPRLSANAIYDVEIANACGSSDPSANIVINNLLGPPSYLNPTLSSAEPVNTATGNYYTSHIDMRVKGRGISFEFARFYNSSDTYAGPLGVGWTHSYNLFLTTTAQAGVVAIKQGDGSQIYFAPGTAGAYTPVTTGLVDSLVKNIDGSFTLTRKNQVTLTFAAEGALLRIADSRGNTESLTYDASGYLILITDTTGRRFVLTNDTHGKLLSVADPIGRVLQYGYDSDGNLVSFQDAAGGITRYAYDAGHHLISGTDARGVVYVQNTYDSQSRVAVQKNGRSMATTFAYNSPSAGITTITDALGNSTQHVYDSSLRVIQVIDAKSGAIGFTYNANNSKISITNANGKTVQFTYDGAGNVSSVIDALGNATSFTYDGLNNLTSVTSPAGGATQFSYDGSNNLLSIEDALGHTTSFTYDSFGELLSRTNALGNKISLTYDSTGNLTNMTDAGGNVTTMAYDGAGRPISVTDANAHAFTLTYDALGRRVKAADPLGSQTQYTFDPVGNLLKVIDANGGSTSYQYDNANNLVLVSDALGNMISYGYDGNNNMISFTNAKLNHTVYSYDSLNHLVKITDPLDSFTLYSYDAVGNVSSVTDANGKTHTFVYDGANRLTKRSYADGNVIVYSFDKNGNRTSMIDSQGTTSYSYNILNRVTAVTSSGRGQVKYGYDGVGRRVSLTYPDGRVVGYAYNSSGLLAQVTDWVGRSTSYTYDPGGRRTASLLANGTASSYLYDSANRLLNITNTAGARLLTSYTYSMDRLGNRVQMTDAAGGINRYSYDALNRLLLWVPPSGQSTTYAYDASGNRISLVNAAGVASSAYDPADRLLVAGASSFTYDNEGNRLTKTTGGTTVTYSFDSLSRLVAVSGGGVSAQYQYDGDGNRISQQAGNANYQYSLDVVGRITAVLNESGPDGSIDFQHGLSTISGSSATLEQFYQTDGVGSTASVTDASGGSKASYSYDPWGKLLNPIDPLGTKDKSKFAGQDLDPQTGLYYMRSRYYDLTSGTFISKDRFAGVAVLPQTTNRYAYALNNPLNFVDPSGFAAEPRASDAIAAPLYNTACVGAITTTPCPPVSSYVPPVPPWSYGPVGSVTLNAVYDLSSAPAWASGPVGNLTVTNNDPGGEPASAPVGETVASGGDAVIHYTEAFKMLFTYLFDGLAAAVAEIADPLILFIGSPQSMQSDPFIL